MAAPTYTELHEHRVLATELHRAVGFSLPGQLSTEGELIWGRITAVDTTQPERVCVAIDDGRTPTHVVALSARVPGVRAGLRANPVTVSKAIPEGEVCPLCGETSTRPGADA